LGKSEARKTNARRHGSRVELDAKRRCGYPVAALD